MNEVMNARFQWDDLRFFLAVAQEGSLSAAARHLGVEHSTVGRRVAQLEVAMGVKLFQRLPRGWALTGDGRRLLPGVQGLEAGVDALSRQALARSGLRGAVRLSAPPVLLNHFVLPRLARWRESHPQIVLHLRSEARNAQLARGESDLALRLAAPDEPGLVARPLASIGYGMYRARLASPGMQGGVIVFDNDLADGPLGRWMAHQLAGLPVVLRSNDLHTMASAARAGWGMALLPHFLAREVPDLVPVEQAPKGPERALHLAMHPDLRRAPRVRALADGLVQLFAQHGALLM